MKLDCKHDTHGKSLLEKNSLLCSVMLFFSATASFCATCSDLDTTARYRIASPLCDTLALLQDGDYAKVRIYLEELSGEPASPPRGTDSASIRYWIDSVYDPWAAKNMAFIAAHSDSLAADYDLRSLNDTAAKIPSTINDSSGSIFCMAKKATIFEMAQNPYILVIEKYVPSYPIHVAGPSQLPLAHPRLLKQECYTIDGKKVNMQNISKNSQVYGIAILLQYFSDGSVVCKKNGLAGHVQY